MVFRQEHSYLWFFINAHTLLRFAFNVRVNNKESIENLRLLIP